MSRKAHQEARPVGWPVEWTFAGFVVVCLAALSQLSRLWPMLSVGHCTSLGGMCTPIECACPEPLRKRELTTPDAQVCYQCVASFCPMVAAGDEDCSVSDCECEDPVWPRQDLQVDGRPCWQCVRPSSDFTVRAGQNASCLGRLEEEPSARLGVISSTNFSDCLSFRYNGARIMEKWRNESCLSWQSFGGFWELKKCDALEPKMRFQYLVDDEGTSQDTLCSGGSEFCLEVAENLCTEEEGRCSTEACRCEDPTWTRQELQTMTGAACYTCAPPVQACAAEGEEACTTACECEGVKLEDALGCFRCAKPTAVTSEMKAGLALLAMGLTVALLRRRSDLRGSWSERLALELAELISAAQAAVDQLLQWCRPPLRKLGKWLSCAIDELDLALEPFYCCWDYAQEAIWDWVVVQHERLVALACWISSYLEKPLPDIEDFEDEKPRKPRVEKKVERKKVEKKVLDVRKLEEKKLEEKKLEEKKDDSSSQPTQPGDARSQSSEEQPEPEPKRPELSRAQRKLQQRRAALAMRQQQKEKEKDPQDPPIDDSWIDELEAQEAKKSKKAKAKKKGAPGASAEQSFDNGQILCEAMHGLYLLSQEVAEEDAGQEEVEKVEDETEVVQAPKTKIESKVESNVEPKMEAEIEEVAEERPLQTVPEEPRTDPNKKENGFEEGRRSRKNGRRPQAQVQPQPAPQPSAQPAQQPVPVPEAKAKAKAKAESKKPEPKPKVRPLRPEPKAEAEKGPEEPKKKRAWSEVVAPWAKKTQVESNLGAGAPEFVPLAQQLQQLGVHDSSDLGTTTVTLSGLLPETTATGLFQQLDMWGLGGSFDFLHIMPDSSDGTVYANINFIDPIFVSLFCCLCQEYQLLAEISVSEVQGIQALTAQWVQSGDPIQAVVVRNAMPSQWAVNAVNAMLSPQLKQQFRKTKLCVNYQKNRCDIGADCPFAHSKDELQPMPDLMKTKMCYNYFRRRCNDPKCKFAHGSGELRSVWAYPTWPLEAFQGFQGQIEAYPVACEQCQEAQGDVFSAERPAESEQGDSILFEPLRKEEGAAHAAPAFKGKVAFRVRKTFMEVEEESDEERIGTMRRSFSDSHLEKLKEAMEESEL